MIISNGKNYNEPQEYRNQTQMIGKDTNQPTICVVDITGTGEHWVAYLFSPNNAQPLRATGNSEAHAITQLLMCLMDEKTLLGISFGFTDYMEPDANP